jgi:hypothetical protein
MSPPTSPTGSSNGVVKDGGSMDVPRDSLEHEASNISQGGGEVKDGPADTSTAIDSNTSQVPNELSGASASGPSDVVASKEKASGTTRSRDQRCGKCDRTTHPTNKCWQCPGCERWGSHKTEQCHQDTKLRKAFVKLVVPQPHGPNNPTQGPFNGNFYGSPSSNNMPHNPGFQTTYNSYQPQTL